MGSAKSSPQHPCGLISVVNYLVSRIILFIVLCVIWISINGRLVARAESSPQPSTTLTPATSTEAEALGKTRPVNLIIINDETNEVANRSVTKSIKAMKDKNPELIGEVIAITVDGRDPTTDMKKICEVWEAAIEEEESPDLLFDTTRAGYAAETVNAFTAAVGIPTLSAQFSQDEDKNNWRYLDADQKKYLVQVVQPTDLIPEVLRQLAFQMDITNVGVIFDESFIMEHKYENLFVNIPARLIIMPTMQSSDEIRRILVEFRKHDLYNYCILGGENTIRSVMNIGQSLNLTGPNYGWYAFTEQDFDPRCDCKNVSIVIFKPFISAASKQRFADLALPTESPLTSAFYYDLVQLGTTAMSLSIARGEWPMNATHIGCDSFNGENTPIRQFDYFKALVNVSAEFQSTLGGIVWQQKNDRHTAKFAMTAKMVTIIAGNPISSKDIGIWPAALDSFIQVRDDAVLRNHSGVPIYRITTVIKAPFVMYDPKSKVWSGYSIDVINAIAADFNFTYVIREANDKKFGSMEKNGTWNGMIKELQDNEADIALSTLSIMAERSSVVDFTLPYYDLVGLSILMKKPISVTSLFKFLSVLDDEVWLCIIGCYVFTTILLWIFNRWSPYAYRKNGEQSQNGDEERRVFDFCECLWFSMTSLTPQGGGEAPMNWSGCIVAGTWWLFGFIIIASYTANLAAFLTVTRLEASVQSLEELGDQYKVQYAPINGSEAHIYFERMSRIEGVFDNIWRDMNLNESLNYKERAKLAVWEYPVNDKYTKMFEAMKAAGFPVDMDEALKRIRHGSSETNDFALIGDATDIRYLELTNCDLLMVGSEFSQKPYAMAVQRGSPLKDILNAGLLGLMKNRKLEILKAQWWEYNSKRAICNEIEEQTDGISIVNIGGVFIVVFVGIILGCVALVFEYYWYSRYLPKHKKKLIRNANFETTVRNPLPIKFTIKPANNAVQANQIRLRF